MWEAMLDYLQDVIKNQWGVSGFRKTILRLPNTEYWKSMWQASSGKGRDINKDEGAMNGMASE